MAALTNLKPVQHSREEEVRLGRVAGPLSEFPLKNINRFGMVQKKNLMRFVSFLIYPIQKTHPQMQECLMRTGLSRIRTSI